jgi:hypothetical protein
VGSVTFGGADASLTVSAEAVRQAAGSQAMPVVIALQSLDAFEVGTAIGQGTARALRITAGGRELNELPGRNVMRLTLPFGDTMADPNTVIVRSGDVSQGFPLLATSIYSPVDRRVSAWINKTGNYFSAANPVNFTDLVSGFWANVHINSLAARGVIDGIGGGRFAPEMPLTRAQFLRLLLNAIDLNDPTAVSGFADVERGQWYYEAIASAAKYAIIPNTGLFRPHDPISREDMALFAYRAAVPANIEFPVLAPDTTFIDEFEISPSALLAVKAMQRAGIISGFEGRFMPAGSTTRAEASKIISMILDLYCEP